MVWEAEARGVPISRRETNYNYNIIQMIFIFKLLQSYILHPLSIRRSREVDNTKGKALM